MAFSTSVEQGGIAKSSGQTMGSVKSDWVLCNNSTETINTDALQDFSTATSYANVIPIKIPNESSRVLLRTKFPAGTDTFTTDPRVVVMVTDDSGTTPDGGWMTRIDAGGDPDAAGTAIPIDTPGSGTDAITLKDGSVVSKPIDLTGYDMLGGSYLYVMVKVISDYEDGGVSQDGEVYALFLN